MRKAYFKIFPGFAQELDKQLNDCKTLLDVGCGKSSPLKYTSYSGKSMGVDGFSPSIRESKKNKIHTEYKFMNLKQLAKNFRHGQFDCVMALDVIEHFDKEQANKLIKDMEKIAKKKVIIFTPNGFITQKIFEGNEFQIHKSGWTVKEMRQKGYVVMGIHGWKKLRGSLAEIKYPPYFLWRFIADVTQLFTRYFPERAFALLCVKKVTPKKISF
jgi:hypothetical protein